MLISYNDYRNELARALQSASPHKRLDFVRDLLIRMLPHVEAARQERLRSEKVHLLDTLVETVWTGEFDVTTIKAALGRYDALADDDETQASGTEWNIIDFLSALDAYVSLEGGANVREAATISESFMNILDFLYTDETPLDQWLATPEIKAEFERQLAFLR